MHLLIVLASENQKSLCSQLFEQAKQIAQERQVSYEISDLYAMDFDPLLRQEEIAMLHTEGKVVEAVKREQEKIGRADRILFIYPVWWWDRPAILKGWFDRVLTQGFAFKMTEKGPVGLLTNKKAAILRTASYKKSYYERTGGQFAISCGIRDGSFRFCGITECREKTFFGLFNPSPAKISSLFQEANTFLKEIITESS